MPDKMAGAVNSVKNGYSTCRPVHLCGANALVKVCTRVILLGLVQWSGTVLIVFNKGDDATTF